ncbi:O-antigen ligase family protein [Desulfoluna sp.]|uniref:O-antigen ligase family protein n=1 Tax=Desulfoluna sp. TaxID=2045199 RepID=UPI00260286FB|nr:O-antigen ligase family protein [Desulfoluna sp.]
MFVPFFMGVFVRSRKQLYVLVACLIISGLIATLYGVLHPQQLNFGYFKGYYKLDRSASLILTMCLALLAVLLEGWREIPGKWRWFLLGLAFLFHWELVMCSIRGAWLGYVVGIVLLVLASRSRMVICFFVAMVVAGLLVGAGHSLVKGEVVSIFDLKTNASNNARLHLWRGGIDFSKEQLFFGSGVKGLEKQYADFFSRQSDDYKKKYHYADKYHAGFHNNYIQILVESGLVTLISVLMGFGGLLWLFFKKIQTVSGLERGVALAAFSVSGGFLVKQFFHMQLTSYGSVAFYFVLFSGMSFSALKNRERELKGLN